MRKITKLTFVLLLAFPLLSHAKIQVFACEPEWKALADEIGGEYVKTFSATTAQQNPHYISAKPSLLAKMRRSDLVFCSGSGLEEGWLPVLLRSAGRAQVQPGNTGYLMASEQVERLEVVTDASLIDRSFGDIHPEGNPHVHLDPRLLLPIAEVLMQRLSVLDTENRADYARNFQAFEQKLKAKLQEWSADIAALKGKQYIAYHKNWSYLADWLGIEIVATIERKPGIAPSMGHISSLVSQNKNKDVQAILMAPFEDTDSAEVLAEKLNTKVIVLPYTTSTDLLELFEQTLRALQT